uniref:Tankyrase 1-binding protein C-terminal domain-containing protein n=1 Tax=Oncorhynchus tshawytscha TaxID=74940 RepID=A0AAZ3R9X6_ONCTS
MVTTETRAQFRRLTASQGTEPSRGDGSLPLPLAEACHTDEWPLFNSTSASRAASHNAGCMTPPKVFFTGMAAQMEVQTGEVGRTGVGGRLHLSPLADSSNKSLTEGPSNTQGSLIITPESSKPVPAPKPRLTPKPFAVEKTPTIRPILAPKPNTKPRPEPTRPTFYKPDPPNGPKPQQPNVTSKHRPVSTNHSRPAPTSYKPSPKLSTGQTTKPVAQPFKPAPLTLGDHSKPTPSQPMGRQKPAAAGLSHSQGPKKPPSVEWSGSTKQEKECGKTASNIRAGGAYLTRAKSMGFLRQIGLEGEERKKGEGPEVTVQLRTQSTGSRPRPVSAIFLPSPTQAESSTPADRWVGRRPLSADLTSKFESIGLSLHRGSPAKTGSKDSSPEEGALLRRREGETGAEGSIATPQAPDSKPSARAQGSEKKKEEEKDEGKGGGSIKRRISLLLDSSSSSPVVPLRVAAQGPESSSPVQPVPEADVPQGGVKQRIKKLTEDTVTPPAQTLAVKPRPLPPDLTKRFGSEKSTDLCSPSPSKATDRHESDTDPQGRGQDSVFIFSDQRKVDEHTRESKEQPTQTFSDPSAGRTVAQRGLEIEAQESHPSSGVQTVRAALFENVVERHSVLVMEEDRAQNNTKSCPKRSVSLKLGDGEKGGSLVTSPYREPVSPSSPLRVEHLFDTVHAVGERRAVSESVPSAQLEDKAMTLRSRHSEGNRPARAEPVEKRPARVQGDLSSTQRGAPASQHEQGPRYLRVGALQKWNTSEVDRGAEVEKGREKERERKEEEKERQREAERRMQMAVEREKPTEQDREREEVAAPKRLKMLEADEQPPKPRATYFALTGQIQEVISHGDEGTEKGDLEVPFDFSVMSGQWGSQGKVKRNPSLVKTFGKSSQGQEQEEELMERKQTQERKRETAWDRKTGMDEMEIEKQKQVLEEVRELEREKGRQRERKEFESEKQRQLEIERQKQLEYARKREMEKQRELERERQNELEKETQRELERRCELERERQCELERERHCELERERQCELERERHCEQERERLCELERERRCELERERRCELERERRCELERERRCELERERRCELERERRCELEREKEFKRERQRQFDLERQKKLERQMVEELEEIKEMETRQLFRFEKQKQAERERHQLLELEKQILREKMEREEQEKMGQQEVDRERQRELERERQRELERERQRELERERQRELEWERQRELERERQRELERERQRELERERQRELERERQRELERERQRELERERQRELERERQRELERESVEELEIIKELEGRQLLEKQNERARQQLQKQRLREKMEKEEQENMRQVARQQEAERQRILERQRRENQERGVLDSLPLRPKVLDLDSVSLGDLHSRGSPHSPGARWKHPSPRGEDHYRPGILDIDSFRSQTQTQPSPTREVFPIAGIKGSDPGSGVRSHTPEREVSRRVGAMGRPSPVWAPSQQELWEQRLGFNEESVDRPMAGPEPPRKPANKPSLEQLLHRQLDRATAPILVPERRWSGMPSEASFPRREPHSPRSPMEQTWFPQDSGPQGHRVEARGQRRSQGSQELNRMRSRSVSRRSAPSESAVEGSLSRMRSRSAHRERDRQSWEQLKQSVDGEEEGRDIDTLVHEADSQYGTWETGLRTDDSLTPATPTSDSNLSQSPREPIPPHTPGEHSDLDTPDGFSPSVQPEMQLFPFPEASTILLDSSALRSRVQLSKMRGPRSRPSRVARQTAAMSVHPEGQTSPTEDWRSRDSTEDHIEFSKQEDSDSEEQERGVDPRSAAASSQPQRVALFPGMDPSALKAQLKKRGDSDNQTDGAAPSPSQLSRSPKSPFLPRVSRVLPPSGGKENGEEASPQWLRELKSKKRSSQYENDS